MKKIYLVLIFLSCSSLLFSQQWTVNLPQNKSKSELTLFDYQNAFYQYWAPYNVDRGYYIEGGVKKKAAGWKQFKRWEYYMQNQVNPVTGEFPSKSSQQVCDETLPTDHQMLLQTTASWTNLGTNSTTGGYAGIGRLNCIAFHPTDNNTYWVGAASGGLWATTNNGATWSCTTDNNGVLAVSDIAIPPDYVTSNTIYIATGDRDAWDNRSVGVLKSTDGGLTWNTTGLSYTLGNNAMVTKLLMDPANSQILLAATTGGVYKTINGGTTWTTQLTTTSFIDMEYKPGDFATLYGSTTDGKIYVSTNSGTSWTTPLNDANAKRIDICVSANQPTWVYAIAAQADDGLYKIYKSIDNGATYTAVFLGTTKNLLGWTAAGTDAGGQGWYDLSISASPTNANTLLIGGVNTWRSTNGGTSWSIVSHWSGSTVQAVHADKHMLKYRSNGDIFETNDGGVYISLDNGNTWIDKTNGIVISQMYKLSVSKTVATETITGLQDNGTKLFSGGTWSDVKGGDGMECLIDYSNVNVQYGTYTNGQIDITTNHWASSTAIEPAAAGSGAWVTPYIIDPVLNQTLYAGYADVWKTTNRGTSWTKISTMNTTNLIRSMAIAPSNTQVLYVADPSIIWKTTNGGTSWTNITGTLPIGSGNITYICVKNDDANTLWVTLSGYTANKVFQSIDGGTTWTNISTGIPSIPAYSIVQNKQSTSEIQLYVATELGVYFKKGAANWVAYNTGLPNVNVGELEIYYAGNPNDSKLRAATYGRGLWETSVYYSSAPMVYVSCTATQNNVGTVSPNLTNQEIIGVEIFTSGNLSPFGVTSFTFNTTGSTNTAVDITNAKLFYTSTNSTFAATSQFGTTVVAPNGTFTITGNQTLSDGTNYFWLTYDIPANATLGDFLDAQCTSVTVVSPRTLTVTNPVGSRQIAITYCDASASICDEFISHVVVGTINNTTACTTGGYADYTNQSTNIVQGATLPITVTNGLPYAGDQCGVWVDWNGNGDFTDDVAIAVTGTPGGGPYTATIACPSNTPAGLKRLRTRIHYNEEATAPCGVSVYGEVEDYSINVVCAPVIAPTIGTITQPTCSLATASVVLNGLPGGTWTLTRTPGGIITNGSGTSTTIADLTTGTYTYTVTNASGCTSVASSNIVIDAQPATLPAPTATATLQPTCTVATGTITVTAPTGFGMTYSIDGSTYVNTTGIFTFVAANTYTVTAKSAVGCISSGTAITVNAQPTTPPAPTATATLQPTCTVATGTITVTAPTGLGMTYSIDGSTYVITTGIFTLVPSNTYTVTAKSAAGCISTGTAVTVNAQPATPPAPTASATLQPTCTVATGTITITAPTGLGMTYSIDGSTYVNTTGIFTLIPSNTYTVTAKNAARCISTGTAVTVNAQPATPPAPTASATLQPTCTVATGTITITAPTGLGMTYSIDGSTYVNTTGIFTLVAANTYIVTAKNAAGCISSGTAVTVNAQPATPPTPTATATLQPTCTVATGTITITAPTGLGMTYSIDGSTYVNTTGIFTLVPSNTYTVTAKNAAGCISSGTAVTVNAQPATPPTPTASATMQPTCAVATGTITITAPTGLGMTYSIDGSTYVNTTGIFTLVATNTYTVTAKNATGCISTGTAVTVNAQPATPPTPTASTTLQPTCNVATGTITITAPTGLGMTYSIDGSTYVNTTGIFTLVGANTYTVTAKSVAGCISSGTAVTVNAQPATPPAPTATATLQPTCTVATGTITIMAPTGLGMTYSIDGSTYVNTTGIFTLVPSNTYTVTAKSSEGCISASTSVTINTQPATPPTPVITINSYVLHSDAPNGNQWYNQTGLIGLATSQDYPVVTEGDYYVIVTLLGCSSAPSNIIHVVFTGIESSENNQTIKVYPNPVSNELVIEMNGNNELIHYEIANALGQVITKGSFVEKTHVATNSFSQGVYVIKFDNGKTFEFKKIIKE